MRRTKHKGKRRGIPTSARKAKGRDLQKWVCQQISSLTGIDWGKDRYIESRPMGQSGSDVRLFGQALEAFPFSVECKRQEVKTIPFSWIKQAQANQARDTDWLLFARRNREKPVVVMDAKQFFGLLHRIP